MKHDNSIFSKSEFPVLIVNFQKMGNSEIDSFQVTKNGNRR